MFATKHSSAIVLFCFLLSGLPSLGEEASPKSPLEASLVLQRGALRAGKSMPVELWLANTGAVESTGIELHLAGPGFIQLGRWDGKRCTAVPDSTRFPLGALKPQSVRHERLCLQAAPEITEGDVNLLFTLVSRWRDPRAPHTSVLSFEKSLSVGLLGTESVGGFSLSLVALIVPGLLFFGLLQGFELKLPERITSIEKAAFCVLLSVLLVEIADVLIPAHLSGGISQRRFLSLCGVAVTAAGLTILGVKLKKWLDTRDLLQLTSDPYDLLSKLLRSWREGGLAIQRGGDEFVGSGAVRLVGGGRLLVGWFEIEKPAGEAGVKIADLYQQEKWGELLDLARKEKLEIRTRNTVKKRGPDGKLSNLEGHNWLKIPGGIFTTEGKARTEELPADSPITLV